MVEEIETEAARVREQTGRPALGVRAILAQDPMPTPCGPINRRPPCSRGQQKARQGFVQAYRLFVSAFRLAAEKLKGGDREAHLPMGSKAKTRLRPTVLRDTVAPGEPQELRSPGE